MNPSSTRLTSTLGLVRSGQVEPYVITLAAGVRQRCVVAFASAPGSSDERYAFAADQPSAGLRTVFHQTGPPDSTGHELHDDGGSL